MTIRVDEQLKKNFDGLCNQFGLSNTAALNLFMKAVVRERRIPFEIKADTETQARRLAWDAFLQMREKALENGASGMTLKEINEEIRAARYGK